MQYLRVFSAISLLMFLSCVEAATAQTPIPTSPAALRQQDRQECATQAVQQNIAKRKQVEFVRKCMVDRDAARKAAARKKLPEEWATEQALVEKRAAKQEDCKKQAREQKLHLAKRTRFIDKCMGDQ